MCHARSWWRPHYDNGNGSATGTKKTRLLLELLILYLKMRHWKFVAYDKKMKLQDSINMYQYKYLVVRTTLRLTLYQRREKVRRVLLVSIDSEKLTLRTCTVCFTINLGTIRQYLPHLPRADTAILYVLVSSLALVFACLSQRPRTRNTCAERYK